MEHFLHNLDRPASAVVAILDLKTEDNRIEPNLIYFAIWVKSTR